MLARWAVHAAPAPAPRRHYAPPPPPPRVGTHPPSEIRRIWLRNGATIDLRLTIPGKERWLKLQKPQKIPVKKRIISEDLLADVGELPAKAPVAPADAKAAAQPVSKPAPAAAEKGKGGGESKNGASHKPKEGGGKQQLKEGKEPQGGAGPNKPAAQKGGDTSKTKP